MIKILLVLLCLCSSTLTNALSEKEYNTIYDYKRNPFDDLQRAQKDAHQEGKLILALLGGDWCHWCRMLEKTMTSNDALNKKLDETFIFLKVNVSEENYNEAFIETLPEINGYPYLVVFDNKGKVLAGQSTVVFQEGDGYSLDRLTAFANQWWQKSK